MIDAEFLEYKYRDSSFFKKNIYHLNTKYIGRLNAHNLVALHSGLIQAKIPSHSIKELDFLQSLGFGFVESEIFFAKIFL